MEKEITNLVRAVDSVEHTIKTLTPMETSLKPIIGDYAFSSLLRELKQALRKFKADAMEKLADTLIKRELPNTDITGKTIYDGMTEQDQEGFNLKRIFEIVEALKDESDKLSSIAIYKQARRLVPWINHPLTRYRCAPFETEHIQSGRYLNLRCSTWNGDHYSYDRHEKFDQIAALEKLYKVALDSADFETVTSDAAEKLHAFIKDEPYFNGDPKLYQGQIQFKHFSARFYKNGNLKVSFKDAETARLIASHLVEPDSESRQRAEGKI